MFRALENPISRYARGFTLIELIVTLAVAAVFVAIAVPSYRATINRNSVATQVNDFLAAMNYARSEAITRGLVVRMCKSSDGANCASSGGWQQGWLIYTDVDNDKKPASTDILRITKALGGGTTMLGNANVDDDIRFDANGFALGNNGTIFACDSEGDNLTNITIASSGRVLSEEPDSGDSCTP